MMNPISIGLAVAVTASLGFAHGEGVGKDEKSPLLDNLWQNDVKVSYTPGSGVTFEAAKGDFSLNIAGRVQAKFYVTSLDGGSGDDSTLTSFKARRVRTKFGGHVFNEDMTYFVQFEHTESPSVLDAIASWRFVNNEDSFVTMSLGLQKFRGGLQSDNSASALEFTERSIATGTFADNRALGALLWGGLMNGDNGHRLGWHIGMANGDNAAGSQSTPEAKNDDSEFMYMAGLYFAPEGLKNGPTRHVEGDLEHTGNFEPLIGVNYTGGTTRVDTDGDSVNDTTDNSQTINVHASIKTGSGIAVQGEYWARNDKDRATDEDTDSSGWYAQASFTTAPGEGTQWAFAARAAMVTFCDPNPVFTANPSLDGSSSAVASVMTNGGDVMEYTAGISAYYHKHKLKTQLNGVFQQIKPDNNAGDLDNMGLDLMFSLFF